MNELIRQVRRRNFIILTILIGSILLLIYRIGYIKYTYGEEYEERAVLQRLNTEQVIYPNRGFIVDRNFHDLAISTIVYNVILDPNILAEHITEEKRNEVVADLAQILNLSPESIQQTIEKNPKSRYQIIKKHVKADTAQKIREKGLMGVWLEEDSFRNYVRNDFAAHLLGFVNADKQAQYGVEQYYDNWLRGVSGRVFPMIKEGKYVMEENIAPQQGHTVVLTIDETIQHFCELALKNAVEEHNPKNAAVIAMNPKTGEILAMAAYPSFNPNKYNDLSEYFDEGIWESLSNEEKLKMLNTVWKNYNLSVTYEPGSTFKPFVIAAALEENSITVHDKYNCLGHKKIHTETIHCWRTWGHGEETLEQALANSCNVAMMDIVEKLGAEKFYRYQKLFGFGEVTGIDLPGEESGILHKQEALRPVELATSSFGQTFNVTPIQLITGFSAIINGGNLMQPYVVKQIVTEDGREVKTTSPVIKRRVISQETSQILRNYLETVVTDGTGKNARVEGYTVGGKTGTAEKLPRGSGKYVLSFIGFAPVEDPQIVVLAILDETENYSEGSVSAAPIVREIFENVLPYMGIEPSGQTNIENKTDVELPDYSGLTLLETGTDLTVKGLKFEAIGMGNYVKKQFPNPGTRVPLGTTIKLYVTENPEEIETTEEESVTEE
ncbi:MAG: PASTA domain-containing protein [Epulopiscium sp.]|nr:PASTA domain-containing protein [Candidatus Epulonipiscium sp.]HOQ16548.1 penicillin-binding transpeptidase domain-containing protein [Defluviitaleaceae bacterium]HPT75870.1 penicillin-binding transpeptidase domain-containing protein [Defluviitaleaceae bacterium]